MFFVSAGINNFAVVYRLTKENANKYSNNAILREMKSAIFANLSKAGGTYKCNFLIGARCELPLSKATHYGCAETGGS